jgi:alkanesulfonate monooxygenase SsuD/methylene tetrahydromethanopterin reductase-like flavin-dependent oxidoreductase (luciferase family)
MELRLGVTLAQTGRCADPASVRSAARAAEQLGFSSVWVLDRPPASTPAPGAPPAGRHDRSPARSLDPLSVLAFTAAVTGRVRLGTATLVTPWYRPELLTRSLASLAVLAEGRLTVGLGAGGATDDPVTIGMPEATRARCLDAILDRLDAGCDPPIADPDPDTPAEPATIGPAGAPRAPRPPVLLACDTSDGLQRIARRGDGWLAAGVPVEVLGPMWAALRDIAATHGRDPHGLELVVRADITVTDRPVDGARALYTGTVEQVAADLVDTRRAGAHEIVLALRQEHCLDEALDLHARLAEAMDLTAVA